MEVVWYWSNSHTYEFSVTKIGKKTSVEKLIDKWLKVYLKDIDNLKKKLKTLKKDHTINECKGWIESQHRKYGADLRKHLKEMK